MNAFTSNVSTRVDDWQNRRVVCFGGQYDSRIKDVQKRDYDTISLGEIFSLNPAAVDKSKAPAFIPSSYCAFNAREHEVQRQNGRYVALTLDIDEGNCLDTDIEDAVKVFVGDSTTFLVYSSSSACDTERKWRAIVPLAEPMNYVDWNIWQRAFYNEVELHLGCKVDHSLGRAAQPVFLPNVPLQRRNKNGAPFFFVKKLLTGSPLGKEDLCTTRTVDTVRQRDKAEAAKAQEARLMAQEMLKHKQRSPGYRGGLIEAYNAEHSIEELMLANGYSEGKRDSWRSPYQSGSSDATKVFGDYWVSLSESDASAGLGAACDSGRYGDAFDLYCHFDHGGDVKAAVKAYSQELRDNRITEFGASEFGPFEEEGVGVAGESKTHPLANYVEVETETFTQDEFVLDGLLVAGMVLLAGAWGSGKTTQLVPLMCRAAHLCKSNDPLRPLLRRRVVYVAEDVGQVRRIIKSMRQAGEFDGISKDDVSDWFKVVSASRLKPKEIVKAASEYAKLATVNRNQINGMEYTAQAVVVFDTRSAVIELTDENDNTEAAAAIATFRQGMPNNPLIVVGHLAKALKRADVKDLSGRGAGAWEADVQQVLYLVNDNGVRWLDVSTPKHRFVAEMDGIEFETYKATVAGKDPLGNLVEIPLMHGVPVLVALGERKKAQAQQAERQEDEDKAALRVQIFGLIEQAFSVGVPLNRSSLSAACKGYRNIKIVQMVDQLVDEYWLLEVEVPKNLRIHPKRSHFLVTLKDHERRDLMERGVIPVDKVKVPSSFRIPEISSIPTSLDSHQEADAFGG